jgi:PIN domain
VSTVKYVLLDTSVLVNCTLVNVEDADPELLEAIMDGVREKAMKLLLPEVIEHEYRRKIPEELERIKRQTKEFRRGVTTQVLPSKDVSTLHEVLAQLERQRDAAVERARDYFLAVAADSSLTIRVPLESGAVVQAIGYALAGRKPSQGPGKGLLTADCLIVSSAASFAQSHNLSAQDTLLICSDNHKDFSFWDKDSSTHVIAEDISVAFPCPVLYYKSPRAFLESELQVSVETNEPLAEALDQYDSVAKSMASLYTLDEMRTQLERVNEEFAAAAKAVTRQFLSLAGSIQPPHADLAKAVNQAYTDLLTEHQRYVVGLVGSAVPKRADLSPGMELSSPDASEKAELQAGAQDTRIAPGDGEQQVASDEDVETGTRKEKASDEDVETGTRKPKRGR